MTIAGRLGVIFKKYLLHRRATRAIPAFAHEVPSGFRVTSKRLCHLWSRKGLFFNEKQWLFLTRGWHTGGDFTKTEWNLVRFHEDDTR